MKSTRCTFFRFCQCLAFSLVVCQTLANPPAAAAGTFVGVMADDDDGTVYPASLETRIEGIQDDLGATWDRSVSNATAIASLEDAVAHLDFEENDPCFGAYFRPIEWTIDEESIEFDASAQTLAFSAYCSVTNPPSSLSPFYSPDGGESWLQHSWASGWIYETNTDRAIGEWFTLYNVSGLNPEAPPRVRLEYSPGLAAPVTLYAHLRGDTNSPLGRLVAYEEAVDMMENGSREAFALPPLSQLKFLGNGTPVFGYNYQPCGDYCEFQMDWPWEDDEIFGAFAYRAQYSYGDEDEWHYKDARFDRLTNGIACFRVSNLDAARAEAYGIDCRLVDAAAPVLQPHYIGGTSAEDLVATRLDVSDMISDLETSVWDMDSRMEQVEQTANEAYDWATNAYTQATNGYEWATNAYGMATRADRLATSNATAIAGLGETFVPLTTTRTNEIFSRGIRFRNNNSGGYQQLPIPIEFQNATLKLNGETITNWSDLAADTNAILAAVETNNFASLTLGGETITNWPSGGGGVASQYACKWTADSLSDSVTNWIPTNWPARNITLYILDSETSPCNVAIQTNWIPPADCSITIIPCCSSSSSSSRNFTLRVGSQSVYSTTGKSTYRVITMRYDAAAGTWLYTNFSTDQPYTFKPDGTRCAFTAPDLPEDTFLPVHLEEE